MKIVRSLDDKYNTVYISIPTYMCPNMIGVTMTDNEKTTTLTQYTVLNMLV